MKIAFFLTGHGFGHGVRNSAIISALPPDVEVDIYTSLPKAFFQEELHRPYRLIPCEIDCGCLQTSTVNVDIEATFARYAELDNDRARAIKHFSAQLVNSRTDLVIGDIPPLAFPIAKAAAIPAWNLCNFDWVDIYLPYLEKHPRYGDMLQRMQEDYSQAQRWIRFFPWMKSSYRETFEEIGMVCRTGAPRRMEFAERFGLDAGKKWCLIYVGSFGLEGVSWDQLGQFSDWEFLGLYPLKGASNNYHQIPKDVSFRYADLTASVDVVLGKLGYGLVSECLSLGKPILFLGRNAFAEFDMLRELVLQRGLGMEISLERFLSVDLGPELKILTSQKHQAVAATGVSQILEKMGFPPINEAQA